MAVGEDEERQYWTSRTTSINRMTTYRIGSIAAPNGPVYNSPQSIVGGTVGTIAAAAAPVVAWKHFVESTTGTP